MTFFQRVLSHRSESNLDVEKDYQECRAKLDAVSRSQAVIEFNMDGSIVTANENFLNALGYSLDEIVGQHHRIFVDRAERESSEYRMFWESMRTGKFHSGEFKRIRKDGGEIWILATYFPIADANGNLFKVVKFASDVTADVTMRMRTHEVGEVVSTSIEQIVQTIAEISGHVSQTAGMASVTKDQVDSTSTSVRQLEESSQAIERILDLIRGLAEQTNLLALNATIESARAGEAGKGFAVVANEVKELARQTAGATDDIDRSINEIKRLIEECVRSTAEVTQGIGTVNESMTSIASAVEEQSATMHSLSETSSVLRRA